MRIVDFGSAVLAFKVLQENGVRKSQAMIYEESDFGAAGDQKSAGSIYKSVKMAVAEEDWIGSIACFVLGS